MLVTQRVKTTKTPSEKSLLLSSYQYRKNEATVLNLNLGPKFELGRISLQEF